MSSAKHISADDLPKIAGAGDMKSVVTLLRRSGDVNMEDGEHETALLQAAKYDRVDMVRFLLENAAEVDKPKANGRTALMTAAQKGKTNFMNPRRSGKV